MSTGFSSPILLRFVYRHLFSGSATGGTATRLWHPWPSSAFQGFRCTMLPWSSLGRSCSSTSSFRSKKGTFLERFAFSVAAVSSLNIAFSDVLFSINFGCSHLFRLGEIFASFRSRSLGSTWVKNISHIIAALNFSYETWSAFFLLNVNGF